MMTNACAITGRLNRLDARRGMSKAGAEFVSVTFTLDVNGNQIRVECFSMKYTKAGKVMGKFQGLDTLINDAKALHKTVREIGETESVEVEDDTIMEDINDCDAITFSSKYTRLEENAYENQEGQLVRTIKVVGDFPNRLDESKKEYVPKADFEIAGKVTQPPVQMEVNEQDVLQMKVMFPIYQDAWQDRPAKVILNEVTLQSRDLQAFEYIEENFVKDAMVYLNGEIVRLVERVEIEVEVDDTRGFGRKVQHGARYKTNVDEYYNLLGGYTLEEDEVEMEKALNPELWEVAMVEREEQGKQEEAPKHKGFGRNEAKKGGVLPF